MTARTDLFFCLAFLFAFLIVFGFLAFWRYLRYKETLALAEKGLVRPQPAQVNGKGTLRWGIVITALGVALSLVALAFGTVTRLGAEPRFYLGPWMLIGLLPTFFGLALVLIYVLTRDDKPAGGGGEG